MFWRELHGDPRRSVPGEHPSARPNGTSARWRPTVPGGAVSAGLPGLLHTALTYRSTDELAGVLVPLVAKWLSGGDRVIVSSGPRRMHALCSELGADAELVRWCDTSRWAPHPARRLRAIHEIVEDERRLGHGQVRFVGEHPFPPGVPELVTEWERFDAALNDALATAPLTMVCAFDVATVPAPVLEHVAGVHPMLGVDPALASTGYRRPDDFLGVSSGLPPLPADTSRLGGQVTPARARSLVKDVLGGEGVDAPASRAVDDFAVAVTELVTNAWQAGAGSIDVWCWQRRGEMGVQVDDDGPGLRAPLAGYRRPSPGALGGRGLWIVRQLVDLVEIAFDGLGTSVRARIFEDRARRLRAPGGSQRDCRERSAGILAAERRGAHQPVNRLGVALKPHGL